MNIYIVVSSTSFLSFSLSFSFEYEYQFEVVVLFECSKCNSKMFDCLRITLVLSSFTDYFLLFPYSYMGLRYSHKVVCIKPLRPLTSIDVNPTSQTY